MENNYGIGSSGRQNEAFVDIPQNRTLMLERLTKNAPLTPAVVHGLQTVQQVFDHFKPQIDVEFENAEGFIKREAISFNDLEDFELRNITARSEFLRDNASSREDYLKVIYQLNSNTSLRTAINNPETKKALLDTIHAMIAEINNNK